MTDSGTPTSDAQDANGRTFALLGLLFLSTHVGLLCLVAFADIGFDHPGKFGMDYDDFVLIIVLYGGVLIAGLAWSFSKRRWKSAVLQICIPVALVGYDFRPYPRYDAAQYQYLKGKSKSEVEGILGTRGAVTGFEHHPDGDREFAAYRGMTVKYSSKGRVMAVTPDCN
jgi:hypothetical protein